MEQVDLDTGECPWCNEDFLTRPEFAQHLTECDQLERLLDEETRRVSRPLPRRAEIAMGLVAMATPVLVIVIVLLRAA